MALHRHNLSPLMDLIAGNIRRLQESTSEAPETTNADEE